MRERTIIEMFIALAVVSTVISIWAIYKLVTWLITK